MGAIYRRWTNGRQRQCRRQDRPPWRGTSGDDLRDELQLPFRGSRIGAATGEPATVLPGGACRGPEYLTDLAGTHLALEMIAPATYAWIERPSPFRDCLAPWLTPVGGPP